MSDLRIQANIDNGDLDPKQLDLFKDQEQRQLTLFPLSYKDETNKKEEYNVNKVLYKKKSVLWYSDE